MLLALTLFACFDRPDEPKPPETPPISPPPDVIVEVPPEERPILEGHPIVRECFADAGVGRLGTKGRGSGGGGTGAGYGTGGGSPAPAPTAAPTAPTPAAPTTARPAPDEARNNAPGDRGTEGSAAAEAAPPAPPAVPAGAPEPVLANDGLADASSSTAGPAPVATEVAAADPAPAPMATQSAPKAERAKEQKGEADRADVAAITEEQARRARLDWGATTWLSNDDSMSLASAQRLLWAVQNKGPVKTREVRPHELLNYFSFDTVDVAPGETFSVLGQAVAAEPGKLTLALAVKGTTPPRRSLDLTYVLDRSGSMWDEGRMDYLKRGLTKMKDQLQRGDRVDVVLFDHELCTPLENYVVGRDDPEFLDDVIAKLQPRGATNLDIGLKEAYRITTARTDGAGRNRRMLLVTDALLNEGEIDPDVLAGISSGFTDHGIRLSTIGVGRSFDDKVLDAISERGKGAYVYLGSEAVVDRVFGAGFRSLTETIAHDVRFGLDLPDSLAMERFYGEEASTVKSDVQPIDYYAGTTQLFLQDVAMRDNTPALADRLVLTIEWTDPVSGERKSTQKGMTLGELVAGEVRNVKKGRALMAWTDLILARSLGADPCDTPYDTWADRVRVLGPDAEVSWLDGLTSPLCGKPPVADTLTVAAGVPFKVKLDADQTIPELGLSCAGQQEVKALSGNVAVFSAQPGVCELRVVGVVPMFASVKVPAGGGDVRCVLRGGRLSCG